MALHDPNHLDLINLVLMSPITLLETYSIFIYTYFLYRNRINEKLILFIISTSFLSFIVLIPYGYPDKHLVNYLSNVSDASIVATFLIRMIILGNDINKKIRVRFLLFFVIISLLFSFILYIEIIFNLIRGFTKTNKLNFMDSIENQIETAALLFTSLFRFFFIYQIENLSKIWKTRKYEIFVYFLLLTHELLFMELESYTKWDWEPIASVYHRFFISWTIILCEQRNITSKSSKTTGPKHMVSVTPASIR